MAIGKVGAYATVEGGIVDYGKMAYQAIDDVIKDDALKAKLAQDKAEAAAKLRAEKLKSLKDVTNYNGSGYAAIDNPAESVVVQYRDYLYQLGKGVESNSVTPIDYNNVVSRANQDITLLNTTAAAIKEKVKTVTDNKDKYMPEFYTPDAFESANNVKPVLDDKGVMTYHYIDPTTKEEKSSKSPLEIVSDVFDKMPLKVNIQEKKKTFFEIQKQDQIEKQQGGLFITTKEKGESLKAAAQQESASWVADYNTRANLWSQYQQTLPDNQRTGPKKDNFSKDEIVTLQKFAEDQLLNMYPEFRAVQQVNKGTNVNIGGDEDKKYKRFALPITVVQSDSKPLPYNTYSSDGTLNKGSRPIGKGSIGINFGATKGGQNDILLSKTGKFIGGKFWLTPKGTLIAEVQEFKRYTEDENGMFQIGDEELKPNTYSAKQEGNKFNEALALIRGENETSDGNKFIIHTANDLIKMIKYEQTKDRKYLQSR